MTFASGGAVASASPRAAAAGVEILQKGGNAFDAAIAVAGVEWLALPGMCGLGGDVFAVLYDAREDRIAAVNGSGIVGGKVARSTYTDQGLTHMPLTGWHAAAVPGAAHAYASIAEAFCTRSLPELLSRALSYAENGIVVSEEMNASIEGASEKLAAFEDTRSAYLPGGHAPRAGDTWQMPKLAATIRRFTEGGANAFYSETAKQIVSASDSADGPFNLEDFTTHTTDIYDPIKTNYRGVDVYETAPPSQGLIVLEWLNLLEGFDLAGMGLGSVDALHTLVETKKLAFADRLAHVADPKFHDTPIERLLSKAYAESRRQSVDPTSATDVSIPGTLRDGDTSYFCVVDGFGNAISFIHSLSAGFGSGVMAGESGVILNNRAGRGFSLEEGHPNVLEPGKKTMHTLNCYLLAQDGKLMGVGGTPGGDRQPQWNVQTITNLIDFGMSPQEAVEAPSWVSWPGTDPAEIATPLELRLEDRFPNDVKRALVDRGHRVTSLGDWNAGSRIQLITRDSDGVLRAATDPRHPGIALGY